MARYVKRYLKWAFPILTLLAGLAFVPSVATARTAPAGWEYYPQYRAAPSAQRRNAQRRKALPHTEYRARRAAHRDTMHQSRALGGRQPAYFRLDARGRVVAVAPRHKVGARIKAQRKRHLARQVALRQPAPGQVQRRPLPRLASLGNAHMQRFTAQNPGRVEAQVDIRSQRMVVSVNGEVRHVWKVSTGKTGFATPRGVYGPQRMHARYFSRKYYNSPMPYSIFFRGGYAVHGTNDLKRLGGPASHGCVRLAVPHARALFGLMKAYGPGRSRIVIS